MDATYSDGMTSDSDSGSDLELEDGLSSPHTTNVEGTDTSESSDGGVCLNPTSPRPASPLAMTAMTARAYQMEMLEQSLEGNFIVTASFSPSDIRLIQGTNSL
jgi:hypothetical protein